MLVNQGKGKVAATMGEFWTFEVYGRDYPSRIKSTYQVDDNTSRIAVMGMPSYAMGSHNTTIYARSDGKIVLTHDTTGGTLYHTFASYAEFAAWKENKPTLGRGSNKQFEI